MELVALLGYLASAILAIVFYLNKVSKLRHLEEQLADDKIRLGNEIADWRTKADESEDARLLRIQLASLTDKLAEATEVLRRAEVAEKWLGERPQLEAERNSMENALAKLAVDLPEKTAAVADLAQKVQELASQIAQMESERTLREDELARLRSAQDELRTQIKQAEELLKQLQQDVNTLDTTKRQLESDCTGLEGRKGQLESACTELKGEIDKAREMIDRLGPKAQEYDSKAQALTKLEDLLTSTQDLQKGISATNKLLMDDLAVIAETRKEGHVALRQAAFAGLQDNPPFTKPPAIRAFDYESTALDNLIHYVQHVRNYALPDRLLYAFHTSLKTSDMSSLTVMAGVSGTGKSALPDLYAKAMGIHLVMLSVEPRWDSPKDLMGFFNYVTNRYEATPLARALFQFQGHHQQGGLHPNPDLNNHMLMVLLDEMNLARIEYYFSEFLSKLELRRGGDMNDPEHRRKVAMEIFKGAAGVEKNEQNNEVEFYEPDIGLLADYNTLFVGTMNEDETTQSLSDKVIDRANVLYFGRPGHLKPKTADVGNDNTDMLLQETWQSWCRSVNPDDALEHGRLHAPAALLARLNDQLAGLGRPFAHRSYQAMLAYLENYPPYQVAQEPNNIFGVYKRPLADQIGMRVMPKLRGLDLAQHAQTLEQVRAIVNEVGDATLETAFEQATDSQYNRSGFFHWQGLDWAHGEP